MPRAVGDRLTIVKLQLRRRKIRELTIIDLQLPRRRILRLSTIDLPVRRRRHQSLGAILTIISAEILGR